MGRLISTANPVFYSCLPLYNTSPTYPCYGQRKLKDAAKNSPQPVLDLYSIPLTAAYWLFFSLIYHKIVDLNDSYPQISDQPLEWHTFGYSGKIRTQLWFILPEPQGKTEDSLHERDERFKNMHCHPPSPNSYASVTVPSTCQARVLPWRYIPSL